MKRSKSGLFLMEMLFAILFFSVAGAVCLQLFAKAHLLSRDATLLNEAVVSCQSAASILEAEGMDALPEYLQAQDVENLYAAPTGGGSDLALQISEEEDAYLIRALKNGGGEEIYSLRLVKKNR